MRLLLALTALFVLFPAYAVPVSGVISRPDGKPAADAQIIIKDIIYGNEQALKVDNAGKFTTDLPLDEKGKFIWRLCVFAPGCALYGGMLKQGENNITLQQGGVLTGRVVDENGKPVAGAMVTPRYLSANVDEESWRIWIPNLIKDTFTAKTNTDGVFKLSNVPQEGQGYLELSDPRFVRTNASVKYAKDISENPPLVARPGATLLGQAFFEDGKPAAGIQVFASTTDEFRKNGGNYAEYITNTDGSFRLSGLATGHFRVGLRRDLPDWTTEELTDLTATEGRETTIKNLVLIHGSVIEGVVTDAENAKPIPGVSVTAMKPMQDGSTAWSHTDANGHYSLRVPPGKYQVVISNMDGYCIPRDGIRVDVDATGTAPKVVPLTLSKGLSLSGIVRDETGKPAAEVPLEIHVLCGKCGNEGCWHDLIAQGVSGTDGTLAISGLTAGKARITTDQFGGPSEWDLVSDGKVQLPSDKPVSITVRKVLYQTLTARTSTRDGLPLAGVLVNVAVYTPIGSGVSTGGSRELISDASGMLTIKQLRPNSTVSFKSAEKSGYQYVSGGKITKQGEQFVMQDIVLSPLNSKLSGLVVDAAGKPVSGAKVTLPSLNAPVATDAQGRFTLEHLPAGEVVVTAASGRAGARQQVATDKGDITIRLIEPTTPKSHDVERATSVLERLWKESAGKHYYARDTLAFEVARLNPGRDIEVNENGKPSDSAILAEIEVALKRDPIHIADKLPRVDLINSSFAKTQAMWTIAQAVVDTQFALASDLYDRIKALRGKSWEGKVYGNLALIGLSYKLNNGEAEALFAEMMEVVQQHRAEENGLGEMVAEALIEVNIQLARKAANALPAEERVSAYSRMVQAIAKKDVKIGQTLLDELSGMQVLHTEWAFGLAVKAMIAAIGKDDPDGALALARKVQGEQRPAALALAAQYASKDTALALLREAAQAERSVSAQVRYAAQAYALDKETGRELFANARKALSQPNEERHSDVADFAFYYAQIDPTESRLLLEHEYARQLPEQNNGLSIVSLTLAMTAIDVDRALEMAQGLPEDDTRFDAQRKIAQYIAATDEVRRTLAFDRWCASDTWTPGEDTGW